jgi:hypothetical protein
LLSFRNNGLKLTVLKENFRPALLRYSSHLFVCYGYGGHLGFQWKNNREEHWDYTSGLFSAGPVAGLDAYAGLEYRIYKIPFTLGLNFKPYAEFSVTRIFSLSFWDFGISLKYTFNSKH